MTDRIPILIGNKILEEHKILTSEESGIVFLYKNGYYVSQTSERILRSIIKAELGEKYSSYRVKETLSYIKDSTIQKIPPELPPYVCLENYILNTDDFTTKDFSHDIFLIHKIPVKYNPVLHSNDWIEYVNSLVSYEKHYKTLQEFVGYVLVNHQLAKKILFTYGNEDSGKSTFFDIIIEFFGRGNCSKLSFHQLCEKFTNAELFGKIANIRADMEYRMEPRSVNLIKSLTGDDEIIMQRKFKDPFSFKNTAKLFLSANGIPALPKHGVDRGFYNRWIPIEFPNTFSPENRDVNLRKKFTTKESKSAILNWAIDGLKRLRGNGWKFSYSPSISELKEWFIGGLIPTDVEYFISQCCLPGSNDWIEKDKLYQKYDEWCTTIGKVKLESNAFHREVKNNRIFPVQGFRPFIDGVQIYTWKGIRLLQLG